MVLSSFDQQEMGNKIARGRSLTRFSIGIIVYVLSLAELDSNSFSSFGGTVSATNVCFLKISVILLWIYSFYRLLMSYSDFRCCFWRYWLIKIKDAGNGDKDFLRSSNTK